MSVNLPLASDAPSDSARNPSVIRLVMIGLGCCVLSGGITAIAVSCHYERQIEERKRAASSETMDRHRDISRLLMYAVSNSDLKQLPLPAFKNWLPIAKVTDDPSGGRRYTWNNYAAGTDGPEVREGEVAGLAWIVVNDNGCIRELDYVSAEF